MMNNLPIRTSNTILKDIENLASGKQIKYMDAVIHYCETSGLEVDVVGEIIRTSTFFKQKIQIEAEQLNFLSKKQNKNNR